MPTHDTGLPGVGGGLPLGALDWGGGEKGEGSQRHPLTCQACGYSKRVLCGNPLKSTARFVKPRNAGNLLVSRIFDLNPGNAPRALRTTRLRLIYGYLLVYVGCSAGAGMGTKLVVSLTHDRFQPKSACWLSAGNEGMTPTNHTLWFPVHSQTLGHSLLSASKLGKPLGR